MIGFLLSYALLDCRGMKLSIKSKYTFYVLKLCLQLLTNQKKIPKIIIHNHKVEKNYNITKVESHETGAVKQIKFIQTNNFF